MNNTLRVILTCAFGGFVGTAVNTKLVGISTWTVIIGYLIGGAVSWLCLNWREARNFFVEKYKELQEWEPDPDNVYYVLSLVFSMGSAFVAFLSTWFLVFYLEGILPTDPNALGAFLVLLCLFSFGATLSSLVLCVISSGQPNISDADVFRRMRWTAALVNPLGLVIGPVIFLAKFIVWAVPRIPDATPIVLRVVWAAVCWSGRQLKIVGAAAKHAYTQAHDRLRTICFIGGSLGTVIGTYYGDPMIGLIAGGVIGAIEYELVARCILGLEPNGA